jgi:hypothetical protein
MPDTAAEQSIATFAAQHTPPARSRQHEVIWGTARQRRQMERNLLALRELPKAKGEAEQRLLTALRGRFTTPIKETPLKDALPFLQERYRVRIVFDQKTLDAKGIMADVAVALPVKDVCLHAVLLLLLEPVGLTCTIRNGVLSITAMP